MWRGPRRRATRIRSLLADARRRHDGFSDYAGCLAMAHEMLAPTMHRVKEAENRFAAHSEPIAIMAEWLPEVLAFFLTTFPEDGISNDRAQIETLERGLADRALRLAKASLRLRAHARVPGLPARRHREPARPGSRARQADSQCASVRSIGGSGDEQGRTTNGRESRNTRRSHREWRLERAGQRRRGRRARRADGRSASRSRQRD